MSKVIYEMWARNAHGQKWKVVSVSNAVSFWQYDKHGNSVCRDCVAIDGYNLRAIKKLMAQKGLRPLQWFEQ